MQAQIPVASTATSVTSVTLTATADAATSPAMTTMPSASQTVIVAAAASASASPTKTPVSTALASTPVAQVSPASSPGLATVLPPVTIVPTPADVSTSLFSPVNVASDLPAITPVPTPVIGTPASPIADTSGPAAGNFTLALNMSAATAQAFGLIIVALALTLAATKLVADYFTPRKNADAKAAKKPAHGKTGNGRTAARPGFFRRSRPHASLAGQPPGPPQQVRDKLPENTA